MPNGQVSVKEAVETELIGIEDPSPELRCIKHLASGFDNLPCSTNKTSIEKLEGFKNKMIGAYILLGCLVGGGILGIIYMIYKGGSNG
jgi:hypothetical protein